MLKNIFPNFYMLTCKMFCDIACDDLQKRFFSKRSQITTILYTALNLFKIVILKFFLFSLHFCYWSLKFLRQTEAKPVLMPPSYAARKQQALVDRGWKGKRVTAVNIIEHQGAASCLIQVLKIYKYSYHLGYYLKLTIWN